VESPWAVLILRPE